MPPIISRKTLARFVAKPITIGLTGAAISMLLDRNAPDITILGRRVPSAIGFGVLTAASSEIAEFAHRVVLPHIPLANKFNRTESLILLPVLGAVSYWGILKITDPNRARGIDLNILAFGAGSTIAGSYVFDKLVEPKFFPGVKGIDDL